MAPKKLPTECPKCGKHISEIKDKHIKKCRVNDSPPDEEELSKIVGGFDSSTSD